MADQEIPEGKPYLQNTVITEFKGNAILVLNPDSRYPVKFGISKANAILEHLEAIKQFVKDYAKTPDQAEA